MTITGFVDRNEALRRLARRFDAFDAYGISDKELDGRFGNWKLQAMTDDCNLDPELRSLARTLLDMPELYASLDGAAGAQSTDGWITATKVRLAAKDGLQASTEGLLARIVQSYEELCNAAPGRLEAFFGAEDRDYILANPDKFTPQAVTLAEDLLRNPEPILLADWVSNHSGTGTHNRSNDKLQYEGASALLRERKAVIEAIDRVRDNFSRIAVPTNNFVDRPALERYIQDVLADGDEVEKRIAATLQKTYYAGQGEARMRNLITIMANAHGSTSSESQIVSEEGLDRLRTLLVRAMSTAHLS